MAKTIMVSDEVYYKLDKIKKTKNYSFSELFMTLLDKPDRKNWAKSIEALIGTWKESEEDRKMEAELKKGWNKWNKGFA